MLIASASPQFSSDSLWGACLAFIQQKVGPSSFETWFRTTELDLDQSGAARVLVPNRFFADFIAEHFGKVVREALSEQGLAADTVSFVPTEKDWKVVEPLSQAIAEARQAPVVKPAGNHAAFHPNYHFSSFVVGDSNRMAHAAALAVAEAPGRTSFNPLVIYGGTGLGKTHLMQAVGCLAQTEETAEHVAYLTSQEFTRQYIDYVVHKRDSTSFYRKFNTVDLLLIDDVHFFSGKPATQREFFRVFNRLLHENKQIVLTSDRPPDRIPDMMDHIISRFMGGLLADIQPPNLETRIAIIQKKAEQDGYSLPEEVMTFLAAHVTSNVRELEGILIKLIAHSSFTGSDISLDIAREICGDLVRRRQERMTVPVIQEKVAGAFGVSANLLTAHTRRRDGTLPRAVAMYLCKKWTKQSLHTIGLQFGGRDYSTVVHCCKKVEADMAADEALRMKVQQLDQAIQALI